MKAAKKSVLRHIYKDLLNDSSSLLEPDLDSREDSYFELDYSGATAVSYCWAPVAGYSTFGKYTGNGSTDGPFVYTVL